jgi:hypothetical protein
MWLMFATLNEIRCGRLNWPDAEARRGLYAALRLEAHVDKDGEVRLSGVVDPAEIPLLDVLGERPREVVKTDTSTR